MKKLSIRVIALICVTLLCLATVCSVAPAAAATVYLRGTFNGWENPADYAMTLENGRYILTTHLSKGAYEYKAATADWSTFQAPVEGNESLTLDADADVTFIAYADSHIIEAYPHSTPAPGVNKDILRCQWTEHNDQVRVQQHSAVY